jgi:hypothetical protein
MSVRITALLALLVAALTLAGSGGAGAASKPKKIDLSTPVAIDAYLQTIGVDPSSVVKQQGVQNYAGPSCPGAGWTCTTSTRVVQVAPAGGQNVADCGAGCVVVQTGPASGNASTTNNTVHCDMTDTSDSAVQNCDNITQAYARNHAIIHESIMSNGGPTQDATQTADVTQQGADLNVVEIYQAVKQSTGAAGGQKQDAHQTATIEQTLDSGGQNFAHVHQTQDQQENGSNAQEQNTTLPPVCGAEKPPNPNQCAIVSQDGGPGAKNLSQLHQAVGERQTTGAMPASQTQGSLAGGQEGDLDQFNPLNVGQNQIIAHQDLAQRQSAPIGTVQSQSTDPGCCGVGTQVGGAQNSSDINQATTQSATGGTTAAQSSTLVGEVHQVAPDTSLSTQQAADPSQDTCSIDQHGRNNSGAGHFDANGTGEECFSLTLTTVCTSGSVDSAAQTQNPCGSPSIVESPGLSVPLQSLATSPTNGADIAMPSYDVPGAGYIPPPTG